MANKICEIRRCRYLGGEARIEISGVLGLDVADEDGIAWRRTYPGLCLIHAARRFEALCRKIAKGDCEDAALIDIVARMDRWGNGAFRCPGRYCRRRRVRMRVEYADRVEAGRRKNPITGLCAVHAARIAGMR